MAQSDPDNSSTPTATASALHVGQNNPYKIGTSEDPVIPEEYCAYLMTSRAPSDSYWYPVHYEPSFMRVQNPFGVDRQACILRSGESGQYTYTVIPGHENDIIDGVQSEQAQQEFNNWRQNPKATELCEFMNDQISGDVDAANRIKNKYGAATFSIFDQLTMYASNYNIYSTQRNWYFLSCIPTINNPIARPVMDQALIDSFLFFDNHNYQLQISLDTFTEDTFTEDTFTEKLIKYYSINCDTYMVDVAGRWILQRGSDMNHPVTIFEGMEYYRPATVRATSFHQSHWFNLYSYLYNDELLLPLI